MDSFCGLLNLYLFKIELKRINPTFDERNGSFTGLTGDQGPEGGESEMQYGPCLDYIERNRDRIKENENLSLSDHRSQIIHKYRLNEFDKRYFKRHYCQLKNANLHDFIQYKLPVWFGGFVLVLIVYSMTAVYTGAPLISSFMASFDT